MTALAARAATTGLAGPVVFWAGAALLALSPLLRGGNRFLVLVPLELLALVVLGGLALRLQDDRLLVTAKAKALLALAAAPLAIAALQLLPLFPGAAWLQLPGYAEFASVVQLAGGEGDWRSLSVAPRATAASLLAGLPLAAALLLGFFCTLDQLRVLLGIVVAVAAFQAVLAAMQLGGDKGFLMFDAVSSAPVGTFGNRNHYGSYVAMALCCWLWLAWDSRRAEPAPAGSLLTLARGRNAARLAVALLLLLGLLMSRSRAAVVLGLAVALVGAAMTQRVRGDARPAWRFVPAAAVALLATLLFIAGTDALVSRFTNEDVGEAAGYRVELARTSLQAAAAFFPFGSGWGTFDLVYPRFQPASVAKFVNHAHMDYVELLVEGGVFFLAFAALFAWLAARRVRLLWRIFAHGHQASREAVAAVFCGLGLAVLLLHALVDFNLRIPALAILGSLLAGAFLRPLPARRAPPP